MSAARISQDDYPEIDARRRGHTGWARVWSDRERKERVFVGYLEDSARKVHAIHQALASGL